ncbi:MAG TPA: SMC family ATPase, partial [Gemmataceae bacterium]|nr:SMC family ATPase [Gemmataceae bacterium]
MIPQRVQLKGFLCYKDEQEIRFDGAATLWMLSGLNGSGKSSIFDAVTYALFGHHRGGGQHAHELINKDSDALLVEFDFLLDGRQYRAKRTLRRNTRGGATGTQQILRRDGGDNGSGRWAPVEETGQKREFDAWVGEHVGLTYETFTSSVLLLQGRAEKLLDSKPEGRREVLAGIVDLERYEKLHAAADEKRKLIEGELKGLKNRLTALPVVEPLALAEADGRIHEAERARTAARAEVERLLGLEARAREWVELQGRLDEARRRWREAERLLETAADIERDVARLTELREVLPRMQIIAEQRNEVHKAEEKIKELTKLGQKLADELTRRDHALKLARDRKTSTQGLLDADVARQRDASALLRQRGGQLEKLKEFERHEADLERLRGEKKRLPEDPASAVACARESFERLTALAQTVPLLNRLASRRDDSRQALERGRRAQRDREAVETKGVQLKAELEKIRARLQEAEEAQRQAADLAVEARTVLQQARESLKDLTHLDGAKVCRHCGQSLTEGHIKEEKRRRTVAAQEAEAKLKQATLTHQAAQQHERRARTEHDQAETARQDLRVEYQALKEKAEQAQAEAGRFQEECGQIYGELPPAYRTRIAPSLPADWLTTTYPAASDLASLRGEAAGLSTARQLLEQAEQVRGQWHALATQETAKLQEWTRLRNELPNDPQQVRREHARLEAEEKSLEKSLTARRSELKQVERELEQLANEREQSQSELNKCDAALKQLEFVRQEAQKTLSKTRALLPSSWQAAVEHVGTSDIFGWSGEKIRLEEAGTEARGRELQQARLQRDILRCGKEELEGRANAFPAESRLEPGALTELLRAARTQDQACEEELRKAHSHKDKLDHDRRERDRIEAECREKDGELAVQKTLAELLGKDRLQLYLVRQAERQVVEHANAVLDRLSAGQLYLKLSGEAEGDGATGKALELEAYNRQTGEKPINVAFLSGSQKFRVAVSLALGIGQYASRQHRPIESVIIDEGFGCLDRHGRQVMIQELQNLRSQMRCILLVSHQEEFAD